MNDILENIVRKKRSIIEARKKILHFNELEKKIIRLVRRDFKKALENKKGVNIIAEIKRASPSAGIIRKDFNPSIIAREYTAGGAAAISVLTEETYFRGDINYIDEVRHNSPLPILCKDFIFDPYQIYEAAAFGADAVLLIVSILNGDELEKLYKTSNSLGLYTLVEVHDESELEIALKSEAQIIGVNNRKLQDLTVNLDTAMELMSKIPKNKLVVIESGIKTAADIDMYVKKGVNTFLVGEALMRRDDTIAALKELVNG